MPANETYNSVPAEELQARIADNDESAFAEIYLRFNKKLIVFAHSMVRSREIAEELVEDVFVALWTNRHKAKEIKNLTIYLYIAVKNRALNILSQKAKELVAAPFDYLDTTVDEFVSDPYELMITSEMMERIKIVVETLPPRCKMIFKLVREDGLRYKEVAEILNISVNTIDAQMAIAVKKICAVLGVHKPATIHHFHAPIKKSR